MSRRRRCEVAARANADINGQCNWLLDHSSVAITKKFLKAVNQTIREIAKNPDTGSFAETEYSNGSQLSIRCLPVRGFEKIAVYYVVKTDSVRILRVVHGARRITSSMMIDDER